MARAMKYVKSGYLEGGHTSGVAALAFSPNGKQVASGGLDSNLCIWDIADMRLIHTFHGASAVLSLAWVPEEPATLVCGMEDGSISLIYTSADTLRGRTFPRSHQFPVEHLAYKDGLLASGAHEDVAIWSRGPDGRWVHLCDLDLPPTNSNNNDRDVLVTSLHWTRSRKHKSLLLVTYLHHGYILVKAGAWTRVLTVPLNGLIGSASVTPDGRKLIVSNMISGFDIYETETGESCGTLTHVISKVFTVPVLFAHGGNAVIGGSTAGKVHVWDATALRMHQVLQHTDTDRILALAAHYDHTRDCFMIATGCSNPDARKAIALWSAEGLTDGHASRFKVWDGALGMPSGQDCLFLLYLLGGLFVGSLAILLLQQARIVA